MLGRTSVHWEWQYWLKWPTSTERPLAHKGAKGSACPPPPIYSYLLRAESNRKTRQYHRQGRHVVLSMIIIWKKILKLYSGLDFLHSVSLSLILCQNNTRIKEHKKSTLNTKLGRDELGRVKTVAREGEKRNVFSCLALISFH